MKQAYRSAVDGSVVDDLESSNVLMMVLMRMENVFVKLSVGGIRINLLFEFNVIDHMCSFNVFIKEYFCASYV